MPVKRQSDAKARRRQVSGKGLHDCFALLQNHGDEHDGQNEVDQGNHDKVRRLGGSGQPENPAGQQPEAAHRDNGHDPAVQVERRFVSERQNAQGRYFRCQQEPREQMGRSHDQEGRQVGGHENALRHRAVQEEMKDDQNGGCEHTDGDQIEQPAQTEGAHFCPPIDRRRGLDATAEGLRITVKQEVDEKGRQENSDGTEDDSGRVLVPFPFTQVSIERGEFRHFRVAASLEFLNAQPDQIDIGPDGVDETGNTGHFIFDRYCRGLFGGLFL